MFSLLESSCGRSYSILHRLGLERPADGADFVLPEGSFMVMDVADVTFGQVQINPGAVMFYPDDDNIEQHTIR